MSNSLSIQLAAHLATLGSSERAKGAQAYMKTADPFFGVDATTLRRVLKDFYRSHAPKDAAQCRAQIEALWVLPEREAKYAAIEWARRFKAHITIEALPLYERMVRSGQWWDTVDLIAAHLVGRLLLEHRKVMTPVIDAWILDPNLWVRRTALLAHLRHKGDTDEARLFRHCLLLAPEKDFFARKAIGWALREYSKAAPEAVRTFLEAHRARLSGLSYREGMKAISRPLRGASPR